MTIKELILSVAQKHRVFKTSDVMATAGNEYTRQYVSKVLGLMQAEGLLERQGAGRGSRYALPENKDYFGNRIEKHLRLEKLKEHEVLDDVMRASIALENMPENVRSIFNYAFSEMLNNAIEHSKSLTADITVVEDDQHALKFEISDYGVGVFRNVMNERGLVSEFEAMQDLLKGKTTTAPQAHSGEGIFFTSKAADLFILESYGYRLRVDNRIPDVFIEELSTKKKGTRVTFAIAANSKRHLIDMFSQYQSDPDQPAFDKTEIQIRLYTMGTIYVSRSQARRVLTSLEKFKTITLDFTDVPTIGQAFADEIFRVFHERHPEIKLNPIKMNEAVTFMVKRAQAA